MAAVLKKRVSWEPDVTGPNPETNLSINEASSRDWTKCIHLRIRESLQLWFPSGTRNEKPRVSIQTQRVLHINNVSTWMQIDPHIQHGYRAESNSFLECFWSLFYFHNEFVNTWSHLLPAIFFLGLLFSEFEIRDSLVSVSGMDNLVVQLYVAGSAACLLLSVRYCSLSHSFDATNPKCHFVAY